MMDYEEYKNMYAAFYNITDEETLRLAHLIDCRLEEMKGILGSANKGTGYWIAEKLIQKGYRDADKVQKITAAAVFNEVLSELEDPRENIKFLAKIKFGVEVEE